MNAKHTPLPWEIDGNEIFKKEKGEITLDFQVVVYDGRGIDYDKSEATANYVYSAVTSHKALLDAFKLAETFLEDGAPNSALRVIKDAIAQDEARP